VNNSTQYDFPWRAWAVVLITSVVVGVAAYGIQYGGFDLVPNHWYFDAAAQRFPLAEGGFIDDFGRYWIWLVPFGGALLVGFRTFWYWPVATSLERKLGVRLALLLFTGPWFIRIVKHLTAMPRPMLLTEFGGPEPLPTSFWAEVFAQGGGALPSAHASAGFVLLGLGWVRYVRQKKFDARVGWAWALAVVLGLIFGWLRIIQGMHSLSQVVWSLAVINLYAALFILPLWSQRNGHSVLNPQNN